MKVLFIMFLVLFILIFLFAKIEINGTYNITLIKRVYASIITSIVITLIIGLPILALCIFLQAKFIHGVRKNENGVVAILLELSTQNVRQHARY